MAFDVKDWIGHSQHGEWESKSNAWHNELRDVAEETEGRVTVNEADIATNAADIVTLESEMDTEQAISERNWTATRYLTGNMLITNAAVTTLASFVNITNSGNNGFTLSGGRTRAGSGDAGMYHAKAQIYWQGNATGWRTIYIAKNASLNTGIANIRNENTIVNNGTQTMMHECTGFLEIAANDYIDILVYQSSGGNLNVIGHSSGLTSLQLYRITD